MNANTPLSYVFGPFMYKPVIFFLNNIIIKLIQNMYVFEIH